MQKSNKRRMQQEVLDLEHYNLNQKIEEMISEHRTSCDKQSLSGESKSTMSQVTTEADDEKKITSLVKMKDFEDYVRRTIYNGSLDKQYEVIL